VTPKGDEVLPLVSGGKVLQELGDRPVPGPTVMERTPPKRFTKNLPDLIMAMIEQALVFKLASQSRASLLGLLHSSDNEVIAKREVIRRQVRQWHYYRDVHKISGNTQQQARASPCRKPATTFLASYVLSVVATVAILARECPKPNNSHAGVYIE